MHLAGLLLAVYLHFAVSTVTRAAPASWAGQATWLARSADAPPGAITIGAGNATWTGTPRLLSWRPLVAAFDSFLSDAECDYLLQKSQPLYEPAMLVHRKEQKHRKSSKRTSHGAFFDGTEDAVLAMISARVAHAVQTRADHFEPYQVMQYGPSEHISSHVDFSTGLTADQDSRFFGHDVETFGGQRVKTALLYLTSCSLGGETVFWKATNNSAGLGSCTGRGLGVKAQKGTMLAWSNTLPNGDPDVLTSHTSCPVKRGMKVVASRFVRAGPCLLNKAWAQRKWNGNVFCRDEHASCAMWAQQGQCTADDMQLRRKMVGDSLWPGFCESTCNACRPLEDTVVGLRRQLRQPLPPGAQA